MPVDFAIPTRQKTDMLFNSSVPLDAGGSQTFDVRLVLGYSSIQVLAFSDQPFSVHLEESCTPTGPFVRTHTLTSAPGPGGEELVCDRIEPCGIYARMVLENTGAFPQTTMRLCAIGVPVP